MKIDTRLDTPLISVPASGDTPANSATNFRDLFEIAKLSGGATTSTSLSAAENAGKPESSRQTAVRELHEYLSKTPEQRMRDAILKSMGLTEDDIKSMPPEQQAAVEAAIKEKVKEKLMEQAQNNADTAVGKVQTYASSNDFKLPMM